MWIYGARGTRYSNTNDRDGEWSLKERWNFTWADMGMLDVPACIEKMQEVTFAPKVNVIGHSQGTAMMWYALSKNQDYFAEKVNRFVAIAACIIAEVYRWGDTYEKLSNVYYQFEEQGYYNIYGEDESSIGFGAIDCVSKGGGSSCDAEAFE